MLVNCTIQYVFWTSKKVVVVLKRVVGGTRRKLILKLILVDEKLLFSLFENVSQNSFIAL